MPSARSSSPICVAVLVFVALCLPACGESGPEDLGQETADAGLAGQPDADNQVPDPPDAAPLDNPDADNQVPDPPDAAAPVLTYPAGPYGVAEGSVIQNLSWQGYVDTDADADRDPFNEPVQTISLRDYYQGFDPGARVIVVNASAGWCSGCQDEASYLPGLDAEYRWRGARFITALFQDQSYSPADTDFAKTWGEFFELTSATVADPNDLLYPYYEDDTVPMNLVIDAANMVIVNIHHGFDVNETRQILETYCD